MLWGENGRLWSGGKDGGRRGRMKGKGKKSMCLFSNLHLHLNRALLCHLRFAPDLPTVLYILNCELHLELNSFSDPDEINDCFAM